MKNLDKKSRSKASVRSKSSMKSKSSLKSATASRTKSVKVKPPGPYDGPDEHEEETRLGLRNPSFKTERIAWSKIMQFPEDCLTIETNECDLIKIRDTFRSCVEVKVIYLAVSLAFIKNHTTNQIVS